MTHDEFTAALAALGWKQSDFCRKAGVAKDTPSRWASGTTPRRDGVAGCLGRSQELAALHAKYLQPIKPAGDRL